MKQLDRHRVLMAELSMTGVFHAGVNAGFIRLMRDVYPDAELHFTAEKSHAEACRKRLSGVPVRYRKFPFFPKANKFTLPLRDLLGCLHAVRLFGRSRKNDTLFITHLLPLTHGLVWILNGIFRRRLFAVLHGQLEAFRFDTPLRATKHYFRLHGFLFRHDCRTRYVILGEPVYKQAKQWFSPGAKVVVIDHPYDYDEVTPVPVWEFPLRFGQIGVGNRGKGTEKLFRLGELLQDEIQAGRVELHLVGRLDPALRSVSNRWVNWRVQALSDPDFEREINRLHYTLLLRGAGCGRAVASGSFFDSVKYGKPFLSLDSAFVGHYAGRFPGCGRVYSSVETMAEAIRRIVRNGIDPEYPARMEALSNARQNLSIQRIAEQFKRQAE